MCIYIYCFLCSERVYVGIYELHRLFFAQIKVVINGNTYKCKNYCPKVREGLRLHVCMLVSSKKLDMSEFRATPVHLCVYATIVCVSKSFCIATVPVCIHQHLSGSMVQCSLKH